MINKFRLSANQYERETEDEKIEPLKIYYLSVEGNITEKEYFEGISQFRMQLGINAKVDVEILKRSNRDTNSAPKYVLELLEEYMRLRELGTENLVEEIPKEFIQKYGIKFIQQFIEEPESTPRKERTRFVTDLRKIGYDINYRRYLQKYNNDIDEFGVLIDRDSSTHSEDNMRECLRYCKEKNYKCYISNPCFEFWLLLHLSDVKEEYRDKMSEIKENVKVSKHHTFVSKEVSEKAHHSKGGISFSRNYLPNIDIAIERAKHFEYEENLLISNIGCNIWKLIEEMRNTEF